MKLQVAMDVLTVEAALDVDEVLELLARGFCDATGQPLPAATTDPCLTE